MAEIAGLSYFELDQLVNGIVADTLDVGYDPDMFNVWAGLTITPMIEGAGGLQYLRLTELDPPRTVILAGIDARIETGVLKLPRQPAPPSETDPPTPTEVAEQQESAGLRLLAKSDMLGLGDRRLLYRIETGEITINRRTYRIDPFIIAAPFVDPETYDTNNPPQLDLTTAPRVDDEAGDWSGPVIAAVPDNWGVDEDGNLFFTAGGVMIGTPKPVQVTSVPGSIENVFDATPLGRALVKAVGATAARALINAVSAADISFLVAAAIAADSTVADAAAAAVGANIAGRNLVEAIGIEGYTQYALVETDQEGRVSRFVDTQGRTGLTLHPDTKIHPANVGDDVPIPAVVATDGTIVFGITDANDRAALAVHPDGSVTILKPSAATLAAFSGAVARTVPEPVWSTKTRVWNAEKALYNYHPTSLQKWYAALARAMAGTGSAHITTFVDSETYGAATTGATPPKWLNSWPGRVRRQLDQLTGYASGTGIVPLLNILFETPTDDPRLTFGPAAAQLTPAGSSGTPYFGVLGRGAVQLTNTANNGWVNFAPVGAVDRFTVYALADAGATGSATVKVDGTIIGTFDVSAAGGGGLARRAGTASNVIVVDVTRDQIVAAIPGFVAGTHVLRVEGPVASTVTLWAVEAGTGKGVRVSNLARSGVSSTAFTLDDTANHRYGMPLHFDVPKADLSIFMLGLNDRGSTSAIFVPRVESAIARVRAAGGDILLVCPGQPDYVTLPGELPPRLTDMYGLADTYDLPLLDLAWVRTNYATANALGLYADGIHSNDTGLEHHARFIVNAITGA